jgi:hypothetical protein
MALLPPKIPSYRGFLRFPVANRKILQRGRVEAAPPEGGFTPPPLQNICFGALVTTI